MNRWEKLEKKPAPMFTKKFGPLSGIRVLLNGTVVAAPFAATMFSDFGAEVIALERPKVKGDTARHQKPQVTNGDKHISGAWAQNARNKLSFTLETNLKKVPESKEIFLSLIKECDVWIENMVWIEKLGITDEMLLEVNPKLVICHVSGFGTPALGEKKNTSTAPAMIRWRRRNQDGACFRASRIRCLTTRSSMWATISPACSLSAAS